MHSGSVDALHTEQLHFMLLLGSSAYGRACSPCSDGTHATCNHTVAKLDPQCEGILIFSPRICSSAKVCCIGSWASWPCREQRSRARPGQQARPKNKMQQAPITGPIEGSRMQMPKVAGHLSQARPCHRATPITDNSTLYVTNNSLLLEAGPRKHMCAGALTACLTGSRLWII